MSLSISEIVKKYLVENGFDGLAGDDCGCGVDELFCCSTCEDPRNYNCVAARKVRQESCEECGNAECDNYGLKSVPEEQKGDRCFYFEEYVPEHAMKHYDLHEELDYSKIPKGSIVIVSHTGIRSAEIVDSFDDNFIYCNNGISYVLKYVKIQVVELAKETNNEVS